MSLVITRRLAQFIKKRLKPGDDPAMTLHFADPSMFFGVISEQSPSSRWPARSVRQGFVEQAGDSPMG
jgi:hypothetical protein